MPKANFSLIDYTVFGIVLCISALIGIYFALVDRKKKSLDDFLLGGRKLKVLPVAMSILASFTSAISILGFSQEMYRYGTMYWLIGFSYFLTQPFAAHIFLPLFHDLKITSAYEVTASLIFCLQMILYMSVVMYTPSVAIKQVLGIPLWVSILITGTICTIYTSIGGIKAVIWTDTLQVLIMFTGILSVIIKGTLEVGGASIVWKRAYESERIEFFDFNVFARHTFWNLIFGGFFTSLTVYGSNQATIQRYLTMKTVREAKIALYLNLIGTFLILTLTCIAGLVAYAIYYDCDLLSSTKIDKGEQILPYLVMDLFGNIPGLPGLFVASLYSASLSTVSSGLNSLAAVCLKDFIQPFFFKNSIPNESRATFLSKVIAAGFGFITIGIAYSCQYLSTTVLQLSLSIFGILGGPLLGVISLGIFCKFANSFGALIGLVCSTVINLWIGFGAVLYNQPPISKPVSTNGCENAWTLNTTKTFVKINEGINIKYVYSLSYLWYAGLSLIVCFVLGIALSFVKSEKNSKEIDEKLYFNWENFKFYKNKKKTKKKSRGIFNDGIDMQNDSEIEINLSKEFEILRF